MIDTKEQETTVSDSILNLAKATSFYSSSSGAGRGGKQGFLPPVPESIAATGLSSAAVEQLILKQLHFRSEMVGRDLSDSLGLKFSLIDKILDNLKRQYLVQVKASLGFGAVSSVFALSEAGRVRARDCLERNQYAGPAPVPLAQYVQAVRKQQLQNGWLTREALAEAYRDMVIHPQVLTQVGPAVNSGKSFLLYGQPGNGKTYLAESLFNLESTPIYVPHAIDCEGTIVKVFDPVYHVLVDPDVPLGASVSLDHPYDGRWALCRRPFIVTGGELTLDMLDLSYNEVAKIYDAPFQLKANNGIYLIDDFGRQQVSPAEVLNRWIVPMARRVDYLSFSTGGKIEVPFETFLIFSTNLRPEQIGDEAFLRRIEYKMLLQSPGPEEFAEIFLRVCKKRGLRIQQYQIERFIQKHYLDSGKPFRRCQPGDTISHAVDLINFEELPMELTDDVLDRAFESCFTHADGLDD